MTAGVRHNVSFETNNIVLIALVAILYSLFKMATVWRSQCAFARLFAGKTGQILNNATDLGTKLGPGSQSVISRKYSTYGTSPYVHKIQEQYDYEIVKNPPEWAYVQRLLPFDTIPQVTPKESYPSGWIPPKEEAKNLPYFIARTKNHELPIYLNITYRGIRQITKIKRIEGDIWLLNDEIKQYLKEKNKRYVETRVHEVGRFIETKGDYVNDLVQWAHSKGF
ncbi:probable 39S ribosomal protein L49, mitochondrial [Spodoptera frugiperda]|uniref:Large ribosomal subunit protein mL49 n=1 Tax=Spodoptera frugiperda TaxID=7108 RepID=A0A9R0EIZ8_SPOFR|nr:probable 39S ribosomal protein L49, mitochondrial [Spodoptera frugiperda]